MSKSWRLIEPKSDLVYRVRGLPAECNEETLKTGIDDVFSLREPDAPVRVHSLAATTSPVSEKTATISSPALSRRLTARSKEWIFEVSSQSLTSCLEDYSQARVIIDTRFQGFTTLYAPSAEEHVVEYAIVGYYILVTYELCAAWRYLVSTSMLSTLSKLVRRITGG